MAHSFRPFRWLKSVYDWVLSFSDRPDGPRALFLIAFAEASFFPIPPDLLLIPLAVGAPRRAFWFATVCTAGSVLGAMLGYLLGLQFFEIIGRRVIEFYSAESGYTQVKILYEEWDALAVAVAGFSPIPYKVFAIAAGVFEIHFLTFVAASIFSRGARFFLVAGLIAWLGPSVRTWIDRYFNLLTVIFALLLIGGFLFLKYAI